MRMTNEQFINEVYHRRDEVLKRRKTRKRIALSVLPVVAILIVSVIYFDAFGKFNKGNNAIEQELADGADDGSAYNCVAYYDYVNNPTKLTLEATQWLVSNATFSVNDEADDYDVTDEETEHRGDAASDTVGSSVASRPALKGESADKNHQKYETAPESAAGTLSEPEGTVIMLEVEGDSYRFVLNEKGLYSCEEQKYILNSEEIGAFKSLIE